MKKPTTKEWEGMNLVKISEVEGFSKWLFGQTIPLVEDDENPMDWAYEWDYQRYIQGLPVID